jgi:predicted MFS family arabinose efflux permease
MGIFGFGVVLAPAIGPSIGGVLVEWWGWRSIFFVVAPFCVIAMAMARRYLPVSAPGGVPIDREGGRLDLLGLGLIAVAVLALLRRHGPSQRRDAAARPGADRRCSLVAAVAFIVHQRAAPAR